MRNIFPSCQWRSSIWLFLYKSDFGADIAKVICKQSSKTHIAQHREFHQHSWTKYTRKICWKFFLCAATLTVMMLWKSVEYFMKFCSLSREFSQRNGFCVITRFVFVICSILICRPFHFKLTDRGKLHNCCIIIYKYLNNNF